MPDPGRFVASTRVVAGFTFLSRLTGLAREIVFARYFGAGELLSAFRIAFMVPNLARRLFGEGALSAAVVPVLTESIRNDGEASSRGFIGRLLILLVVGLVAFVVAAEGLVAVGSRLWSDPAFAFAAITLPYMPLICATAVIGAVLNVRRHFAAPAAAPILLNLSVIAATIGAAWWGGLTGHALVRVVCWSVVVAGILQLTLVSGALRRVGFFPRFGADRHPKQVRSVVRMMGPMVLGLAAVQINSLVDYLIAYLVVVEEGQRVGPAVLGYAQFLYQLPLGIFGVGLGTAIYPYLAERAAAGDETGLGDVVVRGMRLSVFIGLPAAVGLMVTARPLVSTLFERGLFDPDSTGRVAGTLFFYSLGLPAYFVQHVIVRAFYARKDGRTPARIALVMVGLNLVLNLALVFVLQERGLALATAVCATIQVVWLVIAFRRSGLRLDWATLRTACIKTGAVTLIMSGVLAALVWFVLPALAPNAPDWMGLAILVGAGVLAYGGASRIAGAEELTWMRKKGSNSEK